MRLLKAGMMEPKVTAIPMQWHAKNLPARMDLHATIEELLKAVFSMWPMLRLHNESIRIN
jgi:hypothetical protein